MVQQQKSSISSGILQGSVLGPVLFIIFTKDLSDSLFVDDSKLCIKSDQDIRILQNELNEAVKWGKLGE